MGLLGVDAQRLAQAEWRSLDRLNLLPIAQVSPGRASRPLRPPRWGHFFGTWRPPIKQLTERFLFVSLPFRFSADRGRRIQRKMERALVPRRREAVLGFKNAPQLGQAGSFGPGPCHNSDSGSENSSIKKASGNLVRPSA